MVPLSPAEELLRVERLVAFHANQYHALDTPLIEDSEYDKLVELYIQLGGEPFGVGAPPVTGFNRVPHTEEMGSLTNVFDNAQLQEFLKPLAARDIVFGLEHKLDGLAIELRYVGGRLTQALTRGDGHVGEDVTHSVRTIRNVPKRIAELAPIQIRGEVIMPRAGFARVNRERVAAGLQPYANPRNAAAGGVRNLDPAEAASKPLAFVAYAMPSTSYDKIGVTTQSELLDWLTRSGFATAGIRWCGAVEDIQAAFESLTAMRNTLAYDIDGMVIKVDDFAIQQRLGMTSGTPNWATAYKFPAEQVLTKLESVDWQVGRTGVLTPVARIAPTAICGVTVTNVTLHNLDEIKRLDLCEGDTVTLERRGDVIPKITRVWPDMRAKIYMQVLPPAHCPVCASGVVVTGPSVYCPNSSVCSAQTLQRLAHAVSRNALDIRGLGESTLQQLMQECLVSDLADIYALHSIRDAIENLEGFGQQSVDKLLEEIRKARHPYLSRLIYALGIPNVGENTSKNLAICFGTMERLQAATPQALNCIRDIGEVTATSIVEWFADPANLLLLKALEVNGVKPISDVPNAPAILTACITGSFPPHTRDELRDLLAVHRIELTSNVTKDTDLLLAGENPGSKLAKAVKLGIAVMDQTWVNDLLKSTKDVATKMVTDILPNSDIPSAGANDAT